MSETTRSHVDEALSSSLAWWEQRTEDCERMIADDDHRLNELRMRLDGARRAVAELRGEMERRATYSNSTPMLDGAA